MMSANLGKERSLKSAVLCASFDRKLRAETMNARENLRLEKQQRHIEMFKNNTEKTHMAERNRVKSRMQNMRKAVLCRGQSIESAGSSSTSSKMDEESVRLPKLANSTENSGKYVGEIAIDLSKSVPDLHVLNCAENGQKLTHLPTIGVNNNSPRGKRRTLVKEHNERDMNTLNNRSRARALSHSVVEDFNSNLKYPNGIAVESTNMEYRETVISNRRDLLDVGSFQPREFNRLSGLRRRSLSTGDISIAERINSFLGSIESTRLQDSSDSCSGSNSEPDEKESA